ncbi:D-alanyl-D-alanine carboxypeptidase [Streptomyces fuscichromogenes]|uniref:D-alanyl-D-alanine carboxypeptidase n=1 Tax=Streptomyces fuscichromogenes TaxID=1324013 RepID=UPI001E55F7D2|nr:D-alanyl-D-alanine carboxypeptidase [Streptomyces fuscichromogenes]
MLDPAAQQIADNLNTRSQDTRLGSTLCGVVIDAASDRQVWGHDATTALMAASHTKLGTSTATLTVLGPDHRFTTKAVHGDGRPHRDGQNRRRRAEERGSRLGAGPCRRQPLPRAHPRDRPERRPLPRLHRAGTGSCGRRQPRDRHRPGRSATFEDGTAVSCARCSAGTSSRSTTTRSTTAAGCPAPTADAGLRTSRPAWTVWPTAGPWRVRRCGGLPDAGREALGLSDQNGP